MEACVDCGTAFSFWQRLFGEDRCADCDRRFAEEQRLEVERIRAAHDAAVAAYDEVLDQLRPGVDLDIVLRRLERAQQVTSLSPENLRALNLEARERWLDAVTADEVLTHPELRDGVKVTKVLGPLTPEQLSRYLVAGTSAGVMPRDPSPRILVHEGETAYMTFPAALLSEKVVKEYRTNYHSVSVPLGQTGARYRYGHSRGRTVELGTRVEVADKGFLTITSRRVVYAGHRTTLEFGHHRLVGVNVFGDGLGLQVANRKTVPSFRMNDGRNQAAAAMLSTAVALSRKTFVPPPPQPAPSLPTPAMPRLLADAGYVDPPTALPSPPAPPRSVAPPTREESPREPTIHDLKDTRVPDEVEELFTQIARYAGRETIEDDDAGLRFQYLIGILDRRALEKILDRWESFGLTSSELHEMFRQLEKAPGVQGEFTELKAMFVVGAEGRALLERILKESFELAARMGRPPSLTPFPLSMLPRADRPPVREVTAEEERFVERLIELGLTREQGEGLREDLRRAEAGELHLRVVESVLLSIAARRTTEPVEPQPEVSETAAPDASATLVFERAGPGSRTRELLTVLAGSAAPLAPEEIAVRMRPGSDGKPVAKGSVRAAIRNLRRIDKRLREHGALERDVLVVDRSAYGEIGANRYSLRPDDKAAVVRLD